MFCFRITEIFTFSNFDTCFFATHQEMTMWKSLILGFGTVCPTSKLNFYVSQSGLGYAAVTNNSQSQCLQAMEVYFLLCYTSMVCWLSVRGPVQHVSSLQTQAGACSISLLLLCAEDSICFISFNLHVLIPAFQRRKLRQWGNKQFSQCYTSRKQRNKDLNLDSVFSTKVKYYILSS